MIDLAPRPTARGRPHCISRTMWARENPDGWAGLVGVGRGGAICLRCHFGPSSNSGWLRFGPCSEHRLGMEADNGEADFDRPHRPAWTKKRSFAEAFKRGRKGRQRQSGRVGPRSMEECAAWFSRFSAMLPTTDMSILQKVFKKKFVVTSDYSGVGFFEIAIAVLMKNLNSDGNDSTEAGEAGDVECYRASDIDRACRSCLLQHTGKSRPTHIFGDITHRYSRNIRHNMQAVQRY